MLQALTLRQTDRGGTNWTKIGKAVHLSFDLVLVSTVLAGVKRSTGLTYVLLMPSVHHTYQYRPITRDIDSKDMQGYFNKYLDVGEWVLDSAAAYMGSSPYFERRR